MAYNDDLLEHARFLAQLNPTAPKQVDLRRSVSAAYYSLSHLLTADAAQNWKNANQRYRFARLFEHSQMRSCASRIVSRPLPSDPAQVSPANDLVFVAKTFCKLQGERHTADYDGTKVWTQSEAADLIDIAEDAIAAWSRIRTRELAQDFLLDLLGSRQ